MSGITKKSIQKKRFDLAIEEDKRTVIELLLKKPKNKYNAIQKEYNGVTYHSTKEAKYAMFLDRKIKTKEVERWERQLPFLLFVNGFLICKYILDFKVYYADGAIKHIDVKGIKAGVPFQLFAIKQKLMKAIYNIDVYIA
jgi:hypothetical protein